MVERSLTTIEFENIGNSTYHDNKPYRCYELKLVVYFSGSLFPHYILDTTTTITHILNFRKRTPNQIFAAIPKRMRSNQQFVAAQRYWTFLVRSHFKANGIQRNFQFRWRSNEHCIHWLVYIVVTEAIFNDCSFLSTEQSNGEDKIMHLLRRYYPAQCHFLQPSLVISSAGHFFIMEIDPIVETTYGSIFSFS